MDGTFKAAETDDAWDRAVETQVLELRRHRARVWPEFMPECLPESYVDRTFIECFAENARRWPDRLAVWFYGTQITYAELDDLSARFAGWLRRNGVEPGERVGLFLPNCPQFLVLMLGTLRAGAIHVPINPMFKRAELEYELVDAGTKVLIAAQHLSEVVAGTDVTGLDSVIHIDVSELIPESAHLPLPTVLRRQTTIPSQSSWKELVSGPPLSTLHGDPDSVAVLNYTGGTTGMPKGCMHTQRNMVNAAFNCAVGWGILRTDPPDETPEVVLAHTPVFWISGENTGILAPLLSGATIVMLTRWDPEAASIAVSRHRISAMSGVVENYLELLDAAQRTGADLSSLRHLRALSFSQRLTPEIRQQWRNAVGEHSLLREGGYGMTESHTSNTFTKGLQDDDFDLHSEPVFCGLPMPGTDIIVLGKESLEPLSVGEPGQIALRSPSTFLGYWCAPEETSRAFHRGWLLTGDTGSLTTQGCLRYMGRDKDLIKVNGMSVFPSEVEVFLARHPDVLHVAVLGVADDRKGQRVHAFVELAKGSLVEPRDIEQWARDQMAPYKVPTIEVLYELPLTVTGKVLKRALPLPSQSPYSSHP